MKNRKQFVVIGLGRFGQSIAKTLEELGNEVLAIDMNGEAVREISDHVTHTIQLDATDEGALHSVGLSNFDVAVVSIGSDIQSSVMATLLLKEMGVKYIIAKAQSELHAKVLKKIGADRVVLPEMEMGVRVAHNLVSSSILDYIELSEEYSILEIKPLNAWIGKRLIDLELRSKYGINIIAIKENNKINITPSATSIIDEESVLVVIGESKKLNAIEHMIIKQ